MSSTQLSFGVGRATITPPAGLWLSGFSLRDGPMEGVHDDLYVTAVVLGDGTREVAIIGCDLVGLPIEVATAMREEIPRRTGIPGPWNRSCPVGRSAIVTRAGILDA
jgi:hypothetical protein